MKRFQQWIDWWLVTLSFLAFLAIEGAIVYCWVRFVGL
jgi:hypothetical protein